MPLEGAGETAGEEGAGAGAEVGAGAGGMVLAMPLPLADINNIETPGLSSSSFRLRGIPYPTSHIPLIGAHYPPANGWGCGKYENKSAAEGSGNWDWGTNIYPLVPSLNDDAHSDIYYLCPANSHTHIRSTFCNCRHWGMNFATGRREK